MARGILLFLFSYILGSIPFGLLIGLIMGSDIRKLGSGNIGATNVYRSFGLFPAILTMALDGAKGILLPLIFFNKWPMETRLLVIFFAFLGHVFSIFLSFKGGKGVSTVFISCAIIDVRIAVIFAIAWIATLFLSRYASLASMVSLAAACLYSIARAVIFPDQPELLMIACYFAATTIISVYKHKTNIIKLIKGKENKIKKYDQGQRH